MREIIVKIPDTAYEGILNADKAGGNWGNDLLGVLCAGIANGTPLPKGHGRLIDESDLMPDSDYEDGTFYSVSIGQIKRASTIIEADTAEGEE